MPLRRQQLKWLTRGTILAIAPFTLLYIVPNLADVPVPDVFAKLAAVALVVLPLTFSWAIIRYRLMDVDLIFKRGVTYTLATATVVGLYFLLVSIAGEFVHNYLPRFGSWGLIAAIVLAALLFDPLKRAIQERVDKLFDRKRYDYRQTLIEFGRGLSSQTDLDALLTAIVNRLSQTLSVAQVAVFLSDDHGGYTLAAAYGLPQSLPINGKKMVTPSLAPTISVHSVLTSSTWVFLISTSLAPVRISFSKIPSMRSTCPRPSSAPSPRSI